MQLRTATLLPQPVRVLAKLTVGPVNDAHEQEADRVAEEVTGFLTGSDPLAALPIAPLSSPSSNGLIVPPEVAEHLGEGGGQPLPNLTRQHMERAFGHDFGHVRIYADETSAHLSHQVHARAFTHGRNIYFGAGQFQPHAPTGQRLLAHELTHVVQQQGLSSPPIALSKDDWLMSSPTVSTMPLSQILLDIDEIQQWLNEQITTTPESDRLNEALAELQAEAVRRDAQTHRPPPRPRSRRRRQPADPVPPLPALQPRILIERSSIEYADREEMRQQFDLIMEWLAHPGTSAADRSILEIERTRLAPEFQQIRVEAAQERRGRRIQAALMPADQAGGQLLESLASRIQTLSPDRDDPRIVYIYDKNERVAISVEQANDLRRTLKQQLQSASRQFRSNTSGYLDRYKSRLELNIEYPVVSGISGLLGGAEYADDAFWRDYQDIMERTLRTDALLQNGQFVEAAQLINSMAQPFEHVRTTVINFDDAYQSGAEMAVSGLTFIRDAAFAIDIALATIIAAPFVAGVATTAGLTGTTATLATAGGTGLLVGSGMAVVRGGSGALGVALAGGSWSDVTQAAWDDAKRGFREGFIGGASGGAARLLGPAFGVGGQVGQQALRRVGAEALVNGTATMFDTLWQGGSVEESVTAGLRSMALSVPGALVGGSANPLVREWGSSFTSGAVSFIDAAARGVPPGEAMRSASMSIVTSVSTTQAVTRQRPVTPTPTPTPPPVRRVVPANDNVPVPNNVIDLAAVRARRANQNPVTQLTAAEVEHPFFLQQAANDQVPQALPLAAGAEGESRRIMASAGGGSRQPPPVRPQPPSRRSATDQMRADRRESPLGGPPRTRSRSEEPDLVDILESGQPSTARRDVDTPDTDEGGATILPFPSRRTTHDEDLTVGTARQSGVGMAESHHIGSRYQQRIRALFEAVGLDIEGPHNRLVSEEHGQQRGWYRRDSRTNRFRYEPQGHHPDYHAWVLSNLRRAKGRRLPPEQARARVERMLGQLGRIVDSHPEVLQYGSQVFVNRPELLHPTL